MEPWDSIRQQLPTYLRLTLKARHFELSCTRCGHWVVLNRDRVTPEDVLKLAQAHRCPLADEEAEANER